MEGHFLQDVKAGDIVLESLPEDVVASMESRDRWMASLRYAEGGLEFLVADLQSWTPGQVVRVAFFGGSPELYRAIEEATRPISETANIALDFKQGSSYRTWSTSDTSTLPKSASASTLAATFPCWAATASTATSDCPGSRWGAHLTSGR